MKKHIPNIFTSVNLLCGSAAVLFAAHGELVFATYLVFTGIFFDFFDGLAARLLGASSEVGLQLDSLADVITSGLAPSLVMVQLINLSLTGDYLVLDRSFFSEGWNAIHASYLPFFGLLVTVAAAYRLAKFNVDPGQKEGFIGLPTPANAILILSIPLILEFQQGEQLSSMLMNTWVLIGLTVLSCVLMNAGIPLFALKFKSWSFKANQLRYLFLLLSVVLLLWLQFLGLPLVILLYFLLSVLVKR